MIRRINHNLQHLLTTLLLLLSVSVCFAEKAVDDLTGEDKEMFDKFRHLFQNGSPDEFYSFAKKYEQDLLGKKYMMLYYKLKNNEGFYALRHNQVFRAMQYARELDEAVRKNEAKDYYYLPCGLMGDIYNASHDTHKAEQYFTQALEDVGDRDPKFTMRIYMNLAEMLSLKDSEKALGWMKKSVELARQTNNVEYLSMSIAMMAYINFLEGNAAAFYQLFDEYEDLRRQGHPEFSPRYKNIMAVAKMAFDKNYNGALEKVHQGSLAVDSSLVVIRIYALQENVREGFIAMRNRYIEMDSIYSLAQDANFDQLATESSLMQSREEANASKRLAKKLTNGMVIMVIAFLVIYIMGRRRLMKKIWARNKELKEIAVHAEQADQMKRTFIQNMSHEIRTPLNAVAGFSHLLCSTDMELSDEEKADMRQRISDNVEGITAIVDELLELSKSESEAALRVPAEQLGDVNCNDLCRSVMRSLAGKCNPGVEMRFSSAVGNDFTLRTDGNKLMRILTHLLTNAQKFTDKGYIQLHCEQQKGTLLISVADTGIGIKEEDREFVFENFAKVDSFKEGIGLGLPICRRLAASIGGTVTIDDAYKEQGSRFLLSIPLQS